MWIQAENGALLNSDAWAKIEVVEIGPERFGVIGYDRQTGMPVTLKEFATQGEAQTALDTLRKRLSGIVFDAPAQTVRSPGSWSGSY